MRLKQFFVAAVMLLAYRLNGGTADASGIPVDKDVRDRSP